MAVGPPTFSVHSAIKPITRTAKVGGVLRRDPALAWSSKRRIVGSFVVALAMKSLRAMIRLAPDAPRFFCPAASTIACFVKSQGREKMSLVASPMRGSVVSGGAQKVVPSTVLFWQ